MHLITKETIEMTTVIEWEIVESYDIWFDTRTLKLIE